MKPPLLVGCAGWEAGLGCLTQDVTAKVRGWGGGCRVLQGGQGAGGSSGCVG